MKTPEELNSNETKLEEGKRKLTSITGEELQQVFGGNEQGSQPGCKCPSCGAFIKTSMYVIITGQPIICQQCGLKLNIDLTSC